MFDADWTNLALGRSRNASDAQRLILAARDRGCIACGAPTEATHAHHRIPHADGGHTTIDNLQLLCEPCHTHHHQTNDHNHTGEPRAQNHSRSKKPPAGPRDGPTGNHPPPDSAETNPTTRGP